jgi:hypothetical protein
VNIGLCALRIGAGWQRAFTRLAQRQARGNAKVSAKGGHRGLILRAMDEQGGRGVGQEEAHLGRRIGGVERQIDRPDPQRRQIGQQRIGALFHLHRDTVARLDASGAEQVGHLAAARHGLRIGNRAAIRQDQKGRIGRGDAAVVKDREEVLRHDMSLKPILGIREHRPIQHG